MRGERHSCFTFGGPAVRDVIAKESWHAKDVEWEVNRAYSDPAELTFILCQCFVDDIITCGYLKPLILHHEVEVGPFGIASRI